MNKNIIVGDYTYGTDLIKILQWEEGSKLIIGKFCSTTIFLGGNHNTRYATTYPFGNINQNIFPYKKNIPLTNGDVIIGNDVWIGHGSTIMSGIKIGDGSVIAANSHVVENVKPYSVVGGNPAVFYYYRFNQDKIKKLMELKWWDWSIEKIKENIDNLCSIGFYDLL